MEIGDAVLVDYNAVHFDDCDTTDVLWHMRLLLYHVTGNCWVTATPYGYIYAEELSVENPVLYRFEYLGAAGIEAPMPHGVNPAQVRRFGPIADLEYRTLRTQARFVGNGLQATYETLDMGGSEMGGGMGFPMGPFTLPPPLQPVVLQPFSFWTTD
jgi:hypothetical protein